MIDPSKNPVQILRELGIENNPDVSEEYLNELKAYCDELVPDTPETFPGQIYANINVPLPDNN